MSNTFGSGSAGSITTFAACNFGIGLVVADGRMLYGKAGKTPNLRTKNGQRKFHRIVSLPNLQREIEIAKFVKADKNRTNHYFLDRSLIDFAFARRSVLPRFG